MSGHKKSGNGSAIQRGFGAWSTNSCTSGKRAWVSRKDAKSAAARSARGGLDKMGAYFCDECSCYHLGHLPRAVMRGEVGRGDYYGGDAA